MSQREFRPVGHPFAFTWMVDNYLSRFKDTKTRQRFDSPRHRFADPLGYQGPNAFSLSLYPKGKISPDHVALFLRSVDHKVRLNLKLFLLDENGRKVVEIEVKSGSFVELSDYAAIWGSEKFCAVSDIKNNVNKVLVSGAVTFGCELTVFLPKIKPFSRHIGILDKARKDSIFTDMTLVCRGNSFPCHKFMLAAHSSKFLEMLEDMSEDEHVEIPIDDMEPKVLRMFLGFIYNNQVDVSEQAKELFLAADRFDVGSLKEAAECELVNSLNVENVADVLMLFDTYRCETSVHNVFKYAAKNLPAVETRDNWKKLVTSHPELAKSIVMEASMVDCEIEYETD